MEIILLTGALAVAGGLWIAASGAVRSFATARARASALDEILAGEKPSYDAGLAEPLSVRLLGPAWDVMERTVRAVTPRWWLDRLRRHAVLAGLGRFGLQGIVAFKALFALSSAAAFSLGSAALGMPGTLLWIVLAGTIGFIVPDVLIARRADARQAAIRRDLPETLDLLAIAVGAGLGLEQAIELVSRRIPGALGDELHRTLGEIQLGATRREALHNLRERTGIEELATFTLTLAQADAMGSPLSEVLKIQAGEMRAMRRRRAREQAAKTPVKLLFPLLVGIFPAMFVVIVGPAVISIVEAFSG